MSTALVQTKTVMVTGAGGEIGRSICEVFAKEGAAVVVIDVKSEGIAETTKILKNIEDCTFCTIEADVSSTEQMTQAFKTAKEKLGENITILVNCAGILGPVKHLSDVDEEEFDGVIRVNLKGVFVTTKAFLKSLSDLETNNETRGCIVNISSLAAVKASEAISVYSSSKCGIVGLTKSVAKEFHRYRVRCNAVLPGSVDTVMSHCPPEKKKAREAEIAMGRYARPEEIANVCLFLASDKSSYVNGSCIDVNGGI